MALTEKLTAIGNAIRRKTGGTAGLTLDEMPGEILNIVVGESEPSAVLGTKNIDANGTYHAINDGFDGFSSVNVNVPASGIDTSEGDATETDIAAGKIAFADGKRVAGSVPVVENGETQAAVFDVIEKDSTNEGYRVAAHLSKDVLVRNGAIVDTVVPKTSFGEATPDQVLVGTTFTSKEGINLPGAYNPTTVNLQIKRVKPETSFQQVDYDAADGYTGLARVEIEAIQTQSKEIYRNGTYLPDDGKFFDSVTVNILSDAKLGDATSYTFGQIGVTQTSTTASYSCAESIHVEDGEVVLDNATSQTFTMKSSDTSGSCFNGLRGLYFQKSGTTYYVPPDCSIVRSAVKGAGNATTGYAYKGSIYPVIVDAGTVMGTKNITENGTYYASADGFDGFESVNVNVPSVELTPIEVSRRGTASDLASGKQFYDESGNLVTGTVREIAGDDFYVDDEYGVSGKMLTESTVSATWPTDEDKLFRKGTPIEFRFPVSQLGISGGVELPTLTNPGSSTDLLEGKELIGSNGQKIYGEMKNHGSFSVSIDGINKQGTVKSGGYYSSVSVMFDSSAIEALLDAL